MICKNCQHDFEGKFCNNCGQSSSVQKINSEELLNEISSGVFQVNRGLLFTVKELFTRPGYTIREYLNGKRKNHFKPIAYALTLSTLYFLITQITGQNTWMDDLISGWRDGAIEEAEDMHVPAILTWFSKNYAYSSLLLLPIFSLASYLSFSKFNKNYFEHIVLNSFVTGHQAIFYSLFAIVGTVIENDIIEMLSGLTALIYTFWVFWQFFSEGNRALNILRSVMTYILYLIFSMILLFTQMGLYEL